MKLRSVERKKYLKNLYPYPEWEQEGLAELQLVMSGWHTVAHTAFSSTSS